ncbi:MAG: DNA-processing protein DprA [Mycobacteriales bacterium]
MSTDERIARAGLSRIAEPGDPDVAEAVAAVGPVEVWESLRRGVPVGQVTQGVLPGIALRAEGHDPRDDLSAAARAGARLVCPGDPEWPTARLTWQPSKLLEPPPLALWVHGSWPLDEVVERSVAVVGARAASSYGLHVARELGAGLAERRATVISGGAYGIDAAAHRGALLAQSAPSVAVLACGVDVAYPRGNDRLLHQIGEQGLLVSELPPGSHPTRRRFLIRNRLIAALSLGTVVVEAALRSGSLATLERARLLGRHLMAVPGPVTSGMSAGCHVELRNGAQCVTCAAEVLDLVGRMGVDATEPSRGPVDLRDGLSDTVRRVLDALPVRRSVGVAAIAKEAGVLPLVVQQVLPPLVTHGLAESTPDGWRLTPLGAGKPVRSGR